MGLRPARRPPKRSAPSYALGPRDARRGAGAAHRRAARGGALLGLPHRRRPPRPRDDPRRSRRGSGRHLVRPRDGVREGGGARHRRARGRPPRRRRDDRAGARRRQCDGAVGRRGRGPRCAGAAAAPPDEGRARPRPPRAGRQPRRGGAPCRAGRSRDVRHPVGRPDARRHDGYRPRRRPRRAAHRGGGRRALSPGYGEPLFPGCVSDGGGRHRLVRRPPAAHRAGAGGRARALERVARGGDLYVGIGARLDRGRQAHDVSPRGGDGGRARRRRAAPRRRPEAFPAVADGQRAAARWLDAARHRRTGSRVP